MLNLHTVYVVSLVSQATSSLVLAMLAWADRRSRWLAPLALACALHAAAIYLMPLWRGTGHWLPQALSQANLIGMFYLIHLGLRSLVLPPQRRSGRVHGVIVALMLLVFTLARFHSLWCIEVALTTTIFILVWTVRMLWQARIPALRGPLRATAVLLFVIMMHFLVRLPLEPMAQPPPVFLVLRESTMLLVTVMAFSFLALYAAESRRRLHEESRLDALTGLPNRRAMEEAVAQKVKLAARDGRPCALLMLDLDDFKMLNDTWGHFVGDEALRSAGGILLRAAQDVDNCTAARMGGEEFAMLLYDWSVAGARTVAEQMRAEIAAVRIHTGESQVSFTVSIGVGALQTGEKSWAEMLRRADVALYGAKHEGRNRVVLCAEAAVARALEEEVQRGATRAPRTAASALPGLSSRAAAGAALEAAELTNPAESGAALR